MSASPGDIPDRFRRGEPTAIATVARLVRHMVGEKGYFVPHDQRDDVVQEILIHVYRAVSSPEFNVRHGFDAFVRSVAHRRCIDWMRRYRRLEPINPDSPSRAPGPDKTLMTREMIDQGAEVLRSLGSSCLELIRLRVGEGLSYREIASRLERSEGGVRNQMYKCLKRAKAMLEATGRRERSASARGEQG